ncbi:MAG TPA: hypothetical protein VN226_09585 [Anaerolineales bacterium]|nr:hypothetical protein [Anaerolineales bacterium]
MNTIILSGNLGKDPQNFFSGDGDLIVDHYYRHIPAPDDGTHMEKAWNSAAALSEDEILDP